MTTEQITLPDQLAQEAQRAGLLSQPAMERLLREQLQMQHQDFFAAMERMEQVAEPSAMSPDAVAGEIRAMREQRRAKAFRFHLAQSRQQNRTVCRHATKLKFTQRS